MSRRFKRILVVGLLVVLLLCGVWQTGLGAWIHTKAILAQFLLETAWAETLQGKQEVKPWPWADTWPVGRLTVPRLGISRIVLAGASGSSLAFGPGHLFGTAAPGSDGNTVVAGHRDTHFRFLQQLKQGDELSVQINNGKTIQYTITEIRITRDTEIKYLADTGQPRLTLITCYPFDALRAGGPMRYLVIATQTPPDSGAVIRAYLKIKRAQARPGENGRKSGVYTGVNEHFEFVFNAVSASAAILR